MTPNAKHLEILSEVTGGNSDYITVNNCLAAMQILQLRINELEKENERLKESLKRQRGDFRLDEIEGKDF